MAPSRRTKASSGETLVLEGAVDGICAKHAQTLRDGPRRPSSSLPTATAMIVRPGAAHILGACKRSFITLPDFSSFVPPSSSEPQRYNERRVLPFTQKQLYDVVSNVSSYPKFVPFCTGTRILTSPPKRTSDGKEVLEAEMTVGFLAFKESYVSTVTCTPGTVVEAVASSGTPLFKTLSTIWRFGPAPGRDQNSTLVTLDLVYAFSNPLHASVSSAFFGQVSKAMVQAFEDQCRRVYG